MSLPRYYHPNEMEPQLLDLWEKSGVYHFDPSTSKPVFSIDTPPPTVSGNLHLGHTYSYTHTDVFARFHRMRGLNVFYPMGYDDNGLPTERLVEKLLGVTALEIGRQAFIDQCLEISQDIEKDYQDLWQRLGLSIDWRYTYRTIDECSRRTSQQSFLELYKQGLIYRQEAPTIWCPECQTAIAQADVNDWERETEFVTLAFLLDNGHNLEIATTRPELLPACVAVFVHPTDQRYADLIGRQVSVPLFNQSVTIRQDSEVDPEKGTGAVMCCTFGDTIDKHWWYTHNLEYIQAIDRSGRLTDAAGEFKGLLGNEAREAIKARLEREGLLLSRQRTSQIVPVHERCDTPVEFLMSKQWFIRLLDFKGEFIKAGEKIEWHPEHMKSRYQNWVENLAWDWCISRQRYFGIPFPLWYCQACGEVILATSDQLPVDPGETKPEQACQCGSTDFLPDEDILETWATSSLTPQIAGRWICDDPHQQNKLYDQVFPFSLRSQAHEIIRTWAFYTIAKSHFHFQKLPWREVAISGWGIAGQGMGKISKSKGGGPRPPQEMIEQYSADAVRYWAVSTSLGKDAVISEDKIQIGAKLVTKLWNVARFSERFLDNPWQVEIAKGSEYFEQLTPADRWILSKLQKLIQRVTSSLEDYEYAAAKSEIENFFWNDFADNYLEMCKQRLYTGTSVQKEAARLTLSYSLKNIILLFAPFLPFITESIYQGFLPDEEKYEDGPYRSLHRVGWPEVNPQLDDSQAELVGIELVEIATAVRRYKSENSISLGTAVRHLQLRTDDLAFASQLENAREDLMSITRAEIIEVNGNLAEGSYRILESARTHAYLLP
ncbi:MAG: valine--tRNA ligase [Chloroflexota bacterium]|nr:MAG: valine--tRNA ligase [Chloroflexota bacterium]